MEKNAIIEWINFICKHEGCEIADALGALGQAIYTANYISDDLENNLIGLAINEIKDIIESDWWQDILIDNNCNDDFQELKRKYPIS